MLVIPTTAFCSFPDFPSSWENIFLWNIWLRNAGSSEMAGASSEVDGFEEKLHSFKQFQ